MRKQNIAVMKALLVGTTICLLAFVSMPMFAAAQNPPLGAGSITGGSGRVVDPGTSLASCQNIAANGVAGVVSCLIGFMNNALYLIMAAAVLYIVWGAFQLMKEEKRDEAKNTVLFGIIGLFVMISIWGLVNILDKTFNLTGQVQTPPALVAPR